MSVCLFVCLFVCLLVCLFDGSWKFKVMIDDVICSAAFMMIYNDYVLDPYDL